MNTYRNIIKNHAVCFEFDIDCEPIKADNPRDGGFDIKVLTHWFRYRTDFKTNDRKGQIL